MSRKELKEKILLTEEGVMLAKLASILIDSFLSILRSEAPYKLPPELEKAYIPDWGSYYQNTNENKANTEATRKKIIAMIESSKREENQSKQEIDYVVIRRLIQKFDWMALDVQKANISWESALSFLRDFAGFSDKDAGIIFIDLYINIRALVISIASKIGYRKPIDILFDEAKNGNDDAFFKLIALDKGIITTEWASLRIRKATLGGEMIFFNKLGVALNKKPFTKKRKLRLTVFILFFMEFGFKELTYLERVEFLETVGFKAKEIPEQDALRQLIYRL